MCWMCDWQDYIEEFEDEPQYLEVEEDYPRA